MSAAGGRGGGVRRGESCDRAAHPGSAPALREETGAGTRGEQPMSNERPTRDSMPIEEATVSNLWKIRKTS